MTEELRRGFHEQLETARNDLAHLAATVTELTGDRDPAGG